MGNRLDFIYLQRYVPVCVFTLELEMDSLRLVRHIQHVFFCGRNHKTVYCIHPFLQIPCFITRIKQFERDRKRKLQFHGFILICFLPLLPAQRFVCEILFDKSIHRICNFSPGPIWVREKNCMITAPKIINITLGAQDFGIYIQFLFHDFVYFSRKHFT